MYSSRRWSTRERTETSTLVAKHGQELVKKRISVYWDGDEVWYPGKISEYNQIERTHIVSYDDGDVREESLNDPKVMWKLIDVSSASCEETRPTCEKTSPTAESRVCPPPQKARNKDSAAVGQNTSAPDAAIAFAYGTNTSSASTSSSDRLLFWRAGEGVAPIAASVHPKPTRIDHARIHPKYLHSNATSHKWVLGAVAELLDNAQDEVGRGCTYVSIDVEEADIRRIGTGGADETPKMLVFTDDGGGMTREALGRMLSLGMCSKGGQRLIGQYGNGFKTSSIRLGGSALVLTRCAEEMAAGLLSYRFLVDEGFEDVVTPIIGWNGASGQPLDQSPDRQDALAVLLKWSPYKTEAGLLAALRRRCGKRGTCILIYHLWQVDESGTTELDFESDAHDIVTRHSDGLPGLLRGERSRTGVGKKRFDEVKDDSYFKVGTSLRAYATRLYLRPGIKILLRGKPVATHDLEAQLLYTRTYPCVPSGLALGSLGTYQVTLGFVPHAPATTLMGYYLYHRNRLIKPLWRVSSQANVVGRGVLGLVEVDFIAPSVCPFGADTQAHPTRNTHDSPFATEHSHLCTLLVRNGTLTPVYFLGSQRNTHTCAPSWCPAAR